MKKNSQHLLQQLLAKRTLWTGLAAFALIAVALFGVQTSAYAAQIDLSKESSSTEQVVKTESPAVILQGKVLDMNGSVWMVEGPNGSVSVQVTNQTEVKINVAVGDVVKIQLETGAGSALVAREIEKVEAEAHPNSTTATPEPEKHHDSSASIPQAETHHNSEPSSTGTEVHHTSGESQTEVHQSTDHSSESDVHSGSSSSTEVESESHKSGGDSQSGGSQQGSEDHSSDNQSGKSGHK